MSTIPRHRPTDIKLVERLTRQQADEPTTEDGSQQPTDVEVYIDGSEDIEALERREGEFQPSLAATRR